PAKPVIVISTEEAEVNAAAVKALGRDDSLYQRGGLLVRVVKDQSPAAGGIRRAFAPRIEPLPAPMLREHLAGAVMWTKLNKAGEVAPPPPPPGACRPSSPGGAGPASATWRLSSTIPPSCQTGNCSHHPATTSGRVCCWRSTAPGCSPSCPRARART